MIQRVARNDSPEYLASLLHELRQYPVETEWIEFKHNRWEPEEIGEYISALSNAAALKDKVYAYLVWGVDDDSHEVIGTTFRPSLAKKGNEELESWLVRLLNPQIHFRVLEFDIDGKHVAMFEIPRAPHQPVQFQGAEYIRVGSCKKRLKEHPERERELWRIFEVTPFEQRVAEDRDRVLPAPGSVV